MIGLSTMGSISLGCALVAGRKRVPSPAAGKTALRTLAGINYQFGAVDGDWQLITHYETPAHPHPPSAAARFVAHRAHHPLRGAGRGDSLALCGVGRKSPLG